MPVAGVSVLRLFVTGWLRKQIPAEETSERMEQRASPGQMPRRVVALVSVRHCMPVASVLNQEPVGIHCRAAS